MQIKIEKRTRSVQIKLAKCRFWAKRGEKSKKNLVNSKKSSTFAGFFLALHDYCCAMFE